SDRKTDGYVSLYTGAVYFSSPEPTGTFNFSFPYSQKNVSTGQMTSSVFKSANNFKFNNMGGLAGLEVGSMHGFADLEFGLFSSNWPGSGFMNLGGGVILGFSKNQKWKGNVKNRGVPDSGLLLKISVNANVVEHSFDLGSIDNDGYDISVLDKTASSTYTVHEKYSFPKKYNAKQLHVEYDALNICFLPKITLSNNSFKKIFSVSGSVTYVLPMVTYDRIIFNQDNRNLLGNTKMGTQNLTSEFNGQSFNGSPFLMKGFYVSLSLGVNIDTGN
ncbi:MAG: hypothetical protein ACXVP4_10405, partial [Bacteroidia bacterium]